MTWLIPLKAFSCYSAWSSHVSQHSSDASAN
jgi:hypothetical protein